MGSKGVLGMVTPAQFRERTSLTMSRRSGTTLEVDAAYDAYYAGRTEENRHKLHLALTKYVAAHGKHWSACERDKVSGGLLKWLHGFTASTLNADQQAQRRIDTYDIPHSRFGVLYLLGNIEIETDKIAIVLEGVGAVGGAVGSGFATDMNKVNVPDSARHAFTVSGTRVSAQALTSGGTGALTFGRALASSSTVTMQKNTAVRHAPSTAPIDRRVRDLPQRDWFPTTISGLTAAAAGVSDIYNHNKYLGVLAGVGAVAVGTVATPLVAMYDLFAKLWNELKCAFYWIKDQIVAKVLADGAWPYQMLGTVAKAAAKFVLDMVFKHAAPLVGGLIDIGTGIAKTVEAAWHRVKSYLDRKKIHLNPGHPTEIANSIERAMTYGILGGLKDMLKGAGSLTLQAFLPGLGSLANAVAVALEWLIKLIMRVAEIYRIDAFLKEARLKWREARGTATPITEETMVRERVQEKVKLRDSATRQVTREYDFDFGTRWKSAMRETGAVEPKVDGGLIANTEEFTKFFRRGCEASPIIPMLVLNSGICGSLMTFIRLVDDTGERIVSTKDGTGEFDAGNRYFARLKEYGSKYVRASGFILKPLDATNLYIRGVLNHAVQHHQQMMSRGRAAAAFMAG